MHRFLAYLLFFIFLQNAIAENLGPLEISLSKAVAPDCRAPQILQSNPCIAFGNSVYLAVWSDGIKQPVRDAADIYCARIDPISGETLDPKGILVCNAPNIQGHPSVAFDGKQFLIVWEDFRNGRDYDIYATRVDENGLISNLNGLPVSAGPHNQARPSVSYAHGKFFAVWMDARHYPVYSLVGARIDDNGNCLDSAGIILDGESPGKITATKPVEGRWLGSKEYWWSDLSSCGDPSIDCKENHCVVAYRKEFGKFGKTSGAILSLDPDSGRVIEKPLIIEGSWVQSKPAVTGTPKGWSIAFNHWIGGWNCKPVLSCVNVETKWPQQLIFMEKNEDKIFFPHEILEMGYAVGKGQTYPFQISVAWDGKYVLFSMEFGWRTADPSSTYSAILLNYYNPLTDSTEKEFKHKSLRLDVTDQLAGFSVSNPSLTSGPFGQTLLVYEKDSGLYNRFISVRIIKEKLSDKKLGK